MQPVSFASLAPHEPLRLRQAETAKTKAKAARPKAVPAGQMKVHKGDFVLQKIAMAKAFIKVRGWAPAANKKAIPETTNADVLKVADYWTDAIVKYGLLNILSDPAIPRQWNGYATKLKRLTKGKPPNDVYSDNERFWEWHLSRVAIWLNVSKSRPSEWTMMWNAVKEAGGELPETLGHIPGSLAYVGRATGRVIAAPFKGAANELGLTRTNFLIGAGAVVAGVVAITQLGK